MKRVRKKNIEIKITLLYNKEYVVSKVNSSYKKLTYFLKSIVLLLTISYYFLKILTLF